MELRWMRRRILAALGTSGLGALGLVSACRSAATANHDGGGVATSHAPQPPPSSRVFAQCGRDEMRDALCIGFPGSHASVDSCPKWTTTAGANVYDTKHLQTSLPDEAPLDAALTTRYRAFKMPGGGTSNSEVCCYSYCVAGLLKSTPPKAAGRSLCFDAPEGGTSLPAAAPYAECASGLLVGGEQAAFEPEGTRRTRAGDGAGPWIESEHACCYYIDMGFLGRLFRATPAERPRVAAAVASDAWARGPEALEVDALSPDLRETLASRRSADAALEHASVASFAQVSLQLLALGAPPELLRGAHQAALDEIEHAQAMYRLASAYRGKPCGPGPLDVRADPPSAAVSDRTTALTAFARATLEDACIAETAGAVIARRCAEVAQSPALRRLLERIADDEARHAELAWQMLAWAVYEGGAPVVSELRQRLEVLGGELEREVATPDHRDLEPHGLLSRAEEAEILRATFREVVVPCGAAALQAAVLSCEWPGGDQRSLGA